MTDFAADLASGYAGASLTARTGASSGDTVPAGSFVVWVNAGAGAHVITLTNNKTDQGLAVADRDITVAAGGAWGGPIDPSVGDASDRVAVAIDGTATEVTYYVMSRS